MKRINKDDALEKLNESRKIIISMIIGALTLLWTQAFQGLVNDKLKGWNFSGIDFVYFELIVIGGLILVLSWFGIKKKS